MAKPRIFYTMPVRAIADTGLSALDLRVLACVSLHDGMSLLNGKGAGCYASNQTLAGKVQCDYSNLCKSVTKLVDLGYLHREKRGDDARMSVLRVIFEPSDDIQDSRLFDQHSDAEKVGETTNIPPKVVGPATENPTKVVGHNVSETPGNLPETAPHYIPLKGELHSVETGEIDSVKQRDLENRAPADSDIKPTVGEMLARYERALKTDPENYAVAEWFDFLDEVQDRADSNSPEFRWAGRLSEQAHAYLDLPDDQDGQRQDTTPPAAVSNGLGKGDGLAATAELETDAARRLLTAKLRAMRTANGSAGFRNLASSAGVPERRVQAFVAGTDLLDGPSVLRLLRSVNAEGRAAA